MELFFFFCFSYNWTHYLSIFASKKPNIWIEILCRSVQGYCADQSVQRYIKDFVETHDRDSCKNILTQNPAAHRMAEDKDSQ